MRTFQDIIISRQYEVFLDEPLALFFIHLKNLKKHCRIGYFKIVRRKLNFILFVNISVCVALNPLQIKHRLFFLDEHSNAFKSICKLDCNWFKFYTSHLLEVGKLRHLHPIQPHLPAKTCSTQRWRFPVVLNKADVVFYKVNPQKSQTI